MSDNTTLTWVTRSETESASSPEVGTEFVVMYHDEQWHAFLFRGSRYKRGYTLEPDGFSSLESAKAFVATLWKDHLAMKSND